MGMPYSRANFEKRLAEGQKTEERLSQALINNGVLVVKPEYPEGMPRSYYTKNQVDLLANNYILEVKGRNVRFDDVSNYPYPTLFVEGTSGFDAKLHIPAFYVAVSNITGGVIALDVEQTRDTWTVEQITDRKRNYSFPMYVSRTEQWMDWVDFVRRLKHDA